MLLLLRIENIGPIVLRTETAGLDVVIVVANAAIEDDEVVIIGGVDQIAARGVDRDLGRQSGPLRIAASVRKGELRIVDAGSDYVAAGISARQRFGTEARIFVDARDLARVFDPGNSSVLPACDVEFVDRLGLVGDVLRNLIATLRIEAEGLAVIDRGFRKRPDIVENRTLKPCLVAQRQIRGNRDLTTDGSDVLLDAVIVTVDEAVEIVAADAEIRIRAACLGGVEIARTRIGRARPVVRHTKIRQSVQIGVDVVRVQLHGVERRPFRRNEAAIAVVLDIVAAGDAGVLEQATRANCQRRADHLVDVEHDPLGVVGAERGVHIVETILGRRLLGDDVDRAAGGAAARK